MKYAIIITDGAADRPVQALGGKTPLEAANLENINQLAMTGRLGLAQTVPINMNPGSDVAIMSLLGYDPKKYYTGRAPLEASAMGIDMTDEQIAFRCNMVTIIDEVMEDFSAGHIKTHESKKLIDKLNRNLQGAGVEFFPGISYRHLMITGNAEKFKNLKTTPPHDISGQNVNPYLPRGRESEFVINLMRESQKILPGMEVNQVRKDLGENPATSIWLWGQGKKPTIEHFEKVYGLRGAAITAVDLVRGLATLIGWNIIEVDGATGYLDTNYRGKGIAACRALEEVDIVLVHVEAPDEAGHNGDIDGKIDALEQIDREIVAPVTEKLKSLRDWRIMVLPDHPTPIELKTHSSEPVPFLISGSGISSNNAERFTEARAAGTGLKIDLGWQLMEYFLKE